MRPSSQPRYDAKIGPPSLLVAMMLIASEEMVIDYWQERREEEATDALRARFQRHPPFV